MCFKSSEPFLFFCDSELIKGGENIQFCEPFGLAYLVEGLMNQWQWIMIFLHNSIENFIKFMQNCKLPSDFLMNKTRETAGNQLT